MAGVGEHQAASLRGLQRLLGKAEIFGRLGYGIGRIDVQLDPGLRRWLEHA